MEIWTADYVKHLTAEAINLLYEMGYKSYRILEDGTLQLAHPARTAWPPGGRARRCRERRR